MFASHHSNKLYFSFKCVFQQLLHWEKNAFILKNVFFIWNFWSKTFLQKFTWLLRWKGIKKTNLGSYKSAVVTMKLKISVDAHIWMHPDPEPLFFLKKSSLIIWFFSGGAHPALIWLIRIPQFIVQSLVSYQIFILHIRLFSYNDHDFYLLFTGVDCVSVWISVW